MTEYYEYNRHKLLFDSEDEVQQSQAWDQEHHIHTTDIPLVVDMSHWIGCITRCTLPYDMFMDKISDGVILCNFGNTINAMTGFGARRQISNIMYPDTDSEGSSGNHDRHNIASFLQWCKTYGLEKDWLFSVSDLADKQDGRRVLRALLWVGRLAHRRGVPAPQIVKIEEKYGMRYYTFISRIIAEPPIPLQVFFKDETTGEQLKDKRGSRLSVTSFFGRRSSRASVSSNVSVASTGNLPSITEDRKRSLIGGNKKDKKKKRKGSSAVEVPDETELIAPNSDIQQIYMQLMSLVYHKGIERAKPKGYQMAAMEDWQGDLHASDPAVLPLEEFTRAGSPTPGPPSTGTRLTPTSDQFFLDTFSVDPSSAKPTNSFQTLQMATEWDSSSDGAFADDDVQKVGRRSSPVVGGGRGGGGDTPAEEEERGEASPDLQYPHGKSPSKSPLGRQSRTSGEVSPMLCNDQRDSPPRDERLDALVNNIHPDDNSSDHHGDTSSHPGNVYTPGTPAGDDDSVDEVISELNIAADREVWNITEDRSASASINANPKIDFDDVDSEISGVKRKDRVGGKTHTKSPLPLEAAKLEQSIKNSDKVDALPADPEGAKYGSTNAGPDRQRSFSRQQSRGDGGTGISLGQLLLVVICPCRLCFGGRR